MTGAKILVIDEEPVIQELLKELFERRQMTVTTSENGQKAVNILKHFAFDIIISAMKLSDYTGLDLLVKIKELHPSTPVIFITAYGSIENAVEAMKLGAFDYLTKPFSTDAIEAAVDRARESLTLHTEISHVPSLQSINKITLPPKIIGESEIMKQILSAVIRIAKSHASVFITGESGTGKEVIAHAIHYNSLRAHSPFIKVNCAAVPDTLIESEFFGHEKGAFTGANMKRLGRFELANGGSLLLDEVTEIPLMLQAKLLRVIQEQEFERVGSSRPVKVDVRLISTSNREIKKIIASNLLREDLYYRLNVVPIHLPPLRDRKEDIIPLAEFFLEKACHDNQKEIRKFTAAAKKKLLAYSWPGNIRELANVIERSVVVDDSPIIDIEHLYLDNNEAITFLQGKLDLSFPKGISLQELEKRLIVETLQSHQNDKSKAAEVLGISPRKLRNKLSDYEL